MRVQTSTQRNAGPLTKTNTSRNPKPTAIVARVCISCRCCRTLNLLGSWLRAGNHMRSSRCCEKPQVIAPANPKAARISVMRARCERHSACPCPTSCFQVAEGGASCRAYLCAVRGGAGNQALQPLQDRLVLRQRTARLLGLLLTSTSALRVFDRLSRGLVTKRRRLVLRGLCEVVEGAL